MATRSRRSRSGVDSLRVQASCAALASLALALAATPMRATPQTSAASAASSPTSIEVVEVRPNLFLLAGAGGNVAVQVGDDGVVVVDSGAAASTAAVLAAIQRITPKPIRYIINTGPDADHVGGNEALSKAGESIFAGVRIGGPGLGTGRPPALIIATEGVLRHLSAPIGTAQPFPAAAWPTESFHYSRKYVYLNGEAIEVLHQPAAHTDGDAFVFFRRSDVVAAGDVLDTRHFPVIDVERGGSIQGTIAALNRLTDLAVPSVPIVSREAGTVIIPGHGRLYDHFDAINYRDMVTIVRDRVRDLMKDGRSLDAVKAANPANGYVGRYGNVDGTWTANHFVEAVYRSLAKAKP